MTAVIQLVCIVVLAPALQGCMRTLRARLQGRPGPPPLQPYRDLRKLWGKGAVLPERSSVITVAAPGIVLGVALAFATLVPPLGARAVPIDAVAMALLLALGRFVLVLAALGSRSGFAAMAASREMTFASLTEAPFVLALVSAGFVSRTLSHGPVAGILAAGALLLVMLSETARMPVDNQETHYELTMIHEGLVLEYGGWPLALLQAAAYVRQAAFFVLAAELLPGGAPAVPMWIVLFAGVIPLVERTYAKLRLFEVPQLFVSAGVLALASIGLRIAGCRRMVIGAILTSAALLTLDSRLRTSLVLYLAFTAATLALAFPHPVGATAIAFVATLALLKLVVGPVALVALVRRYKVSEDLAPSFGLAWRLLIVALTLIAAHEIRYLPALANLPSTGVVFYAVFASVMIVVLHRSLLAHVMGLLMLGSAITLAGAVFAPELPEAIELAGTFDAVMATLLALAIARALMAFDPNLDIRSLRELRG